MDKTVKITKEDYQNIDKIAKYQRRTKKEVLSRAIQNYYNSTIGNTVRTKKS